MNETVTCYRCQGDGITGTYWEKETAHNVTCPDCNGEGQVPKKSWQGEESVTAWRRVGNYSQ